MDETSLAKIRNEKLGFVFQDFMLLDGLTIRENILIPRIIKGTVDKDGENLADQLIQLSASNISRTNSRQRYPEVNGSVLLLHEVL